MKERDRERGERGERGEREGRLKERDMRGEAPIALCEERWRHIKMTEKILRRGSGENFVEFSKSYRILGFGQFL